MSRIGKEPIKIPEKIKIEQKDGFIFVDGPKGKLNYKLPKGIKLNVGEKEILVEKFFESSEASKKDERLARSMHGLVRTLVSNMLVGVSEGFKKELDVIGVGYRVQMKGDKILNLFLGHAHSIDYFLPEGVSVIVSPSKGLTKLTIESHDKQLVGEVAAQIRKLRPPEPYKGKGIRYSTESIKKKAGKSAIGK